MLSSAFFKGMAAGGSLIVAIGAQNAFLLRQGLQRQHVLTCVLLCIVCDISLIVIGAGSIGQLILDSPWLLDLIRTGGALFLLEYGRRAAMSAWRGAPLTLAPTGNALAGHAGAARAAVALSLLNPHAWLDTVVLLGAIGAQETGLRHTSFYAGAMTASALWFTSLGFGARVLAPLFAKTDAWRVLDALIALIMWSIAVSLLLTQYQPSIH